MTPDPTTENLVHITPIWRTALTDLEYRNVSHSMAASTADVKVFLAPESLNTDLYQEKFPTVSVHRMPDPNFRSVSRYSFMMMQPHLYEMYSQFTLMMIVQTDAVLLRPLDSFGLANVDYVGAPWPSPLYSVSIGRRLVVSHAIDARAKYWHRAILRVLGRKATVGNGGLSVRRPDVFRSITHAISHQIQDFADRGINEDIVFATLGEKLGLRVAPEDLAARTFRERITLAEAERLGVIGVHAPLRNS
jgi:hypothetical protein